MKLESQSFKDGEFIPGKYAFVVPDAAEHFAFSSDINPHFGWSDVPEGTQSFVLICHDPDVPSSPDDVNQADREVPESLPRVDFYHWLLFDIPSDVREIAEGSQSSEIVPHGKHGPSAPEGYRHGLNDFTTFMSGEQDMRGDYYGYDGPFPPWNDAIVHHYTFTLYAIDKPHLDVVGSYSGANVMDALKGVKVLAKASITGLYSLNPRLLEQTSD